MTLWTYIQFFTPIGTHLSFWNLVAELCKRLDLHKMTIHSLKNSYRLNFLWTSCNCTYNVVSVFFPQISVLYQILFQLRRWWEQMFVTAHCSRDIEYRYENICISWCTIVLLKTMLLTESVKTILESFYISYPRFQIDCQHC